MVRITPHPLSFPVADERLFLALLKALFTQRNRKLRNALERFLRARLPLDKRGARLLVEDAPHVDSRVHALSPRELGDVANRVGEILQGQWLEYGGRVFYVHPEVYAPADDSDLLVERLPETLMGTRVLDVGTGCGILAVIEGIESRSRARTPIASRTRARKEEERVGSGHSLLRRTGWR